MQRERPAAPGDGDVPRYMFTTPLWAVLVLVSGLLLTAWMAWGEWKSERDRVQSLQRSLADAAPARLREPLAGAALGLRAMQTVLLAGTEQLDQATFDSYQRNLRSQEWIHGYVLIAFAQRRGNAGDDGEATYRYQYVAPLGGNEVLVGFDIARQPENMEALRRARDADAPAMSAPFAAERYGLMPAVDRWVIRTALVNFAHLHPCGERLQSCAINLSGASLEDEGLADFILDAIDRHGVPPQRLCLEITETVAVRDLLRVVRVIERLRAVGCRIALDDFGAGMASFGYLKNLPVDVIKIDGSFVRDLGRDPMSRTIVDAVTRIGHQRGARVVAEWVDDLRTLDLLRELGIDSAQGFALHRPERVVFQRGDAEQP